MIYTTNRVLWNSQPAHRTTKGKCVRSAADLADFAAGMERRAPVQTGELDLGLLDPGGKWLNRLFADQPIPGHPGSPTCKIGDFFKCSRGIATGANEFFCLREPDIHHHGLAVDDFDACVTKAVDLSGWIVSNKDFRKLVKSGKRCYLLNPDEIHPEMDAYLAKGMAAGVHLRHLPSKRPVWYLPERRKQPSILVPVFSRHRPRFILNSAGLRSLTCFHGLYPKPGAEHLVPLVWIYLNSTRGLGAFGGVNRFYGNGLNKLEPKDVEQMACPDLGSIAPEHVPALQASIKTASSESVISEAWFDEKLADFLPATASIVIPEPGISSRHSIRVPVWDRLQFR